MSEARTFREILHACLGSSNRLHFAGNPWASNTLWDVFAMVERSRLVPNRPIFPTSFRGILSPPGVRGWGSYPILDDVAWSSGLGLSMSSKELPSWRPFYGLDFDPLRSRRAAPVGYTALSFIPFGPDPEGGATDDPRTKIASNGFTAKLALEGVLSPSLFRPGRLMRPPVRSRYARIAGAADGFG